MSLHVKNIFILLGWPEILTAIIRNCGKEQQNFNMVNSKKVPAVNNPCKLM